MIQTKGRNGNVDIASKQIGQVEFPLNVIVSGDGEEISQTNPMPVAIQGAIPVTIASAIEITNDSGSPIPVSGPVTDAQMRASPIPVSLPPQALGVDTGLSQPLTDAQLRASAVPVSVANLPIPNGAATEATLEAARALLAVISAAVKAEDNPAVSGDSGIPLLALRQSADTVSTSDDGDYANLKTDEEGRLKVATKPASYADITGDITAVQAAIGTPVAGGTVSGDVSRASNVMAFCTGTFAGVNVSFEGSLEAAGDTNWFAIQAVRSNANTIETTTGALSAQPAYAWEMSVNGLARVRVRCTARTSGTQSWRFKLGTYATEPIPAAQISGTQPISGSVTITPGTPSQYTLNSAATTNAAVVKASAGTLYAATISNTNAAARYLKLYNKATAPTVGTDVPVLTVALPASSTTTLNLGVLGVRFATGIGIALTTGAADSDTTAVAASEIKVFAAYV